MSNKSRAKLKNKFSGQHEQGMMARSLDDLMEFEAFQDEVLPMLRKAIKEGWPAEKIYAMAEAHAAARTVTIALTEEDAGKALAAIKETMDRSKGKSIERKEIKAEISNMSDADLDELLQDHFNELNATSENKTKLHN